ncbi:MAG: ABC transporter ATP-binding protein [Verrucomicrobiota bacterium]
MMVTCNRVSRTYGTSDRPVHAVQDVTLSISDGEFLAITGPSGSGKSTLLHLIGSLDTLSSGHLEVAGLPLESASEAEKTQYRREMLGIIFQFFNLLPTLTVEENVMLPLTLQGSRRTPARNRALELLHLVGLEQRGTHFSGELSGGEMQRVAIARALAHEPKLVIADEPTGNLDSRNRDRILDILRKIHEDQLTTLIVVTHEEEVAQAGSRRVHMADGKLVQDSSSSDS